MILEGLLVDLVPLGKTFRDLEPKWRNNESSFWGSGGERYITPRSKIEANYREWDEERWNGRDPGVPFGIQTKDGKAIGFMGLTWVVPHHRLAMLGAKIGETEYWGGGYGTDALLLAVDYAFHWLDLHKVWLATSSMNARVMRQMEKVGFTLEASLRDSNYADGVWYEAPLYGMLREEWPGRETIIERLGLKAR